MKCTIMELITDFTPIEKLLLPNGRRFADDARNVINSWDSNDILACPGSGKTTVLIAKLKLIADELPLKDGRGVCVLSHTNVAVNELKAKLGQSAERLLSYPNFVGTIQTFVDQYITFPFLRQFADASIQVVSNDDYAKHLRLFGKLEIAAYLLRIAIDTVKKLPTCYLHCDLTKKQLFRPREFKALSPHYLYMIASRD